MGHWDPFWGSNLMQMRDPQVFATKNRAGNILVKYTEKRVAHGGSMGRVRHIYLLI